jgi:hypothetical protein
MKKLMIVGVVLVVAVLALGVAGFASAQAPNPTPQTPFGAGGMMHGGGMMGRGKSGGMMGGGEGLLHEYMIQGWAEAFEMSVEDLEARIAEGDPMSVVAGEKGLTTEEFQALMVEVRSEAIQAALADGVITQEQADWMLSRPLMGRAAGGCGGMRGRWYTQPAGTDG